MSARSPGAFARFAVGGEADTTLPPPWIPNEIPPRAPPGMAGGTTEHYNMTVGSTPGSASALEPPLSAWQAEVVATKLTLEETFLKQQALLKGMLLEMQQQEQPQQ